MAGRAYLGQAVKYPHEVTQFGDIALENDIALVRQSIIRILDTPTGSGFFNEGFGSDLHELLYEPNSAILFSLLDTFIIDAIALWEKRVRSVSTIMQVNENDPSRIDISLKYVILQSNEIDGFIFPFYTQLKS